LLSYLSMFYKLLNKVNICQHAQPTRRCSTKQNLWEQSWPRTSMVCEKRVHVSFALPSYPQPYQAWNVPVIFRTACNTCIRWYHMYVPCFITHVFSRLKHRLSEKSFTLFIHYPLDKGLFIHVLDCRQFQQSKNGSLCFDQSEMPWISLGDSTVNEMWLAVEFNTIKSD